MAKTIASGIFVVRKDGQLLVAHPTNHAKDFWSIPKGKVEDDETFLEGAIRETYEETNLDLANTTDFEIIPLSGVNYSHRKKILYPFIYLEKKESKFKWDKITFKCNSMVDDKRGQFPEMDDFKWVSLEEASKLLHETQVKCLTKIEEYINEKA